MWPKHRSTSEKRRLGDGGGAGADRRGAQDGDWAAAEHALQRARQAQAGGGRRERQDGLQHRWGGVTITRDKCYEVSYHNIPHTLLSFPSHRAERFSDFF